MRYCLGVYVFRRQCKIIITNLSSWLSLSADVIHDFRSKQNDDDDDDADDVDRSENSELHHARELGRREQQDLSRENEKLIKKLEIVSKYGRLQSLGLTTIYFRLHAQPALPDRFWVQSWAMVELCL